MVDEQLKHTGELFCDSVKVCHFGCSSLALSDEITVSWFHNTIRTLTRPLLAPRALPPSAYSTPNLTPAWTRINRVNVNVTRPPSPWRFAAQQDKAILVLLSHFSSFTRKQLTDPSSNTTHQKESPKCSHSLVKRLSSPHSLLSPALALFHVFNSMLIGVCMLLEVVRMLSLVEVVLGDVRSFSSVK
jgi:hypothetical protein